MTAPRNHDRRWRGLSPSAGRERRPLPALAWRRMTGEPVETFGLYDHGSVIEGRRADAIAFDPERISGIRGLLDPRAPSVIRRVAAASRVGPTYGDRRLADGGLAFCLSPFAADLEAAASL